MPGSVPKTEGRCVGPNDVRVINVGDVERPTKPSVEPSGLRPRAQVDLIWGTREEDPRIPRSGGQVDLEAGRQRRSELCGGILVGTEPDRRRLLWRVRLRQVGGRLNAAWPRARS